LREAADHAQRAGQTVSWLFRRASVQPAPAATPSAAASTPPAPSAGTSLPAGLEPLAVFAFADTLKAGARAAIDELKARHLTPLLLSGDNPGAVAALAGELGITQFEAQVSPRDKAARVNARKVGGHVVAMVGDGINDAPALAAADVGIAMGGAEALAGAAGTAAAGGSDIAMHAAGITLMRGDPRLVAAALDISAATVRKIRQNLFWAFIYNLVGIPLAALGGLTPMWAGAAMAASSVSVVANALLLARWKPAP
jgi:Cu+-exporting ATPase